LNRPRDRPALAVARGLFTVVAGADVRAIDTEIHRERRTFGNPNFGRIFSARNPREMRVGLRFSF
jgi:hypothetical protein